MENKEYKIETFTDMVNCTTPENLDAFLADLRQILGMAHLVKAVAKLHNSDETEIQKHFTWIDDGINKVTMDLRSGDKSLGTLISEHKNEEE